ncbi:MAG: glycerol-3-phosphate 1-O-acyltransferase PlsY [Planctomycetes bacterium]|nr:glycerol-3-phosphate 1-O-acyltransferase PlsY [Planctomycetota bacterium]
METYHIICALAGYLIGSIPFGYIIVKLAKGIDIRTIGSGNIGATNVARVMGWPIGILAFLLDAFKGVGAFVLAFLIMFHLAGDRYSLFEGVISFEVSIQCGFLSVFGHIFPVWFKFKGGKGIATSFGFFIIIMPFLTIISLCIWLLLVIIFRYISLASILSSFLLLINLWLLFTFGETIIQQPILGLPLVRYNYIPILYATSFIVALIIIKHIPNIKRLMAGTEPKVNFRRRKDDKTLNP